MNENLKNYIHKLLPMTHEKLDELVLDFNKTHVEKGHLFIQDGKLVTNSYFLESGFVRSFIFDVNGNEITTNIFSAPCFISDFLALFKQCNANENFQAITDCNMYEITFKSLQIKFHTIPEFREFGRMMLVTNYSILHERMIGMIKDTAEMRYLKLLQQHPAIFQNVPLKIIASYLGITDTSLSRIRKDLMHK